MLAIRRGEASCTIYPELGGSLGRWTVAGQEMLRAANPEAIVENEPLGMASFPLVPYSNRIAGGAFEWDGRTIKLAKNFLPGQHSIHGIGWQRPWLVSARDHDCVRLTLMHHADAHWPWAFDAEQRIAVDDQTLTLNLIVRNRSDRAAPLAFGHHPYFDAAGAVLVFASDAVWMSGDDALPTEPISPHGAFDFSAPAPVEGRTIDHCYAGIAGPARISWADRPLALEIESFPQLGAAVVYIPQGGDAFCFEPVPHINNALNLAGHHPAMPVIAAGDAFETRITFRATPK
jgi:aldose 1-epimerase